MRILAVMSWQCWQSSRCKQHLGCRYRARLEVEETEVGRESGVQVGARGTQAVWTVTVIRLNWIGHNKKEKLQERSEMRRSCTPQLLKRADFLAGLWW